MKRIAIFLLPFIFILNLISCSKREPDPAGPVPVEPGVDTGIQNTPPPDGIWKSNGIIFWGSSSNAELTLNFTGGELFWDTKYYSKTYPDNEFVYNGEFTVSFNYSVDNSFIILPPPSGNQYWGGTMCYHYKNEGDKLTMDKGSIFSGNSNSLSGSVWESDGIKYIFNSDNSGVIIYGTSDSLKFTYSTDGNTLSYKYEQFGMKSSYTGIFGIKDKKLYIYDKPGAVQTRNGSSSVSESIILFKSVPESAAKDYFPLQVGNSWTFDYGYSPSGSYGANRTSGKLSWEIISVSDANTDKTVKYNVRETFTGIRIPSIGSKDTVYIGPDTAYFNITEDALHRISINSSLTALGQVTIKRYYDQNTPDSTNVSTVNYTSHNLTLVNNKGVIYWYIGGSSNGDLSGSLRLTRALLVK